jgi:hypothetical protein
MFLVKSDDKEEFYGVNTDKDYIMEKDEIDSVLQIEFKNILENTNDEMENRLIQEMIRDPSIFKKIPQELKDNPSFKRKVDIERTKRKVRVLDTIGDRTGTVDFSNTILPHDSSHRINQFILDNTEPPEDLHELILEKSMRLSPIRHVPRQTCKESNCSISGGKRKNRTRKNKKKRYGRL